MVNFKFLSLGFNSFVNEMCALITHEDLWASKPCYDILKNELHNYSYTTILKFSCFFPYGQILCPSDNVSLSHVPSWCVKRSHKINGPFLEYLQC
jgi:hypothetical protein